MKALSLIFILSCFFVQATAQTSFVLQADRVFDGEQLHEGWLVIVEGESHNRCRSIGSNKTTKE
jgi:hypothetical protein